jgi:hypothetical protein
MNGKTPRGGWRMAAFPHRQGIRKRNAETMPINRAGVRANREIRLENWAVDTAVLSAVGRKRPAILK